MATQGYYAGLEREHEYLLAEDMHKKYMYWLCFLLGSDSLVGISLGEDNHRKDSVLESPFKVQ